MNFLVRWFFPSKSAQVLQMLQEAYRKQFEEFEGQVEVERLQFHADMVEFQERKTQVDGLKVDMEARWAQFKMRLMDFIMPEAGGYFDWLVAFEIEFVMVFGGVGDMDEAYRRLIQLCRELFSRCDWVEGVAELELLEIRDKEFMDVRTMFLHYKVVIENNEKKLKTVLDDYEVQSRNYDAYQRMRSIGPYSPSIQAMNGTLQRTQPMGWIGLYVPWIHALNGWIGLYFPWIHGTMAEREIDAVVEDDVVDEAVVEAVIEDGVESVGYEIDDEFERGIM